MVALVGKVERRLETRADLEQRRVDLADARRQGSLELIERRARLERRHRVDEILHRLRLDQIHAPAQVGAKRELARLGQPRPRLDCRFHDRVQEDGTPVCADLEHVFAGVRVRGGEEREHGAIDSRRIRRDANECRAPRLQRSSALRNAVSDPQRARSADANHPDPAAPRRSRDGDDGVIGGKHGLDFCGHSVLGF